jgi:hypothetical protein
LPRLRDPPRHHDRLPAGGRAVVHRGVGDFAAVKPRHLGLEFEQGLQRPLRDLRLIGRVAGQELAALDQMVDAGRECGGGRRRSRGRRALPPPQGCVAPSRPACRSTAISLAWSARPSILRVEPRRLGHVDEQVIDRCGADRCAACPCPIADQSQRKVTHGLDLPDTRKLQLFVSRGVETPRRAQPRLTSRAITGL